MEGFRRHCLFCFLVLLLPIFISKVGNESQFLNSSFSQVFHKWNLYHLLLEPWCTSLLLYNIVYIVTHHQRLELWWNYLDSQLSGLAIWDNGWRLAIMGTWCSVHYISIFIQHVTLHYWNSHFHTNRNAVWWLEFWISSLKENGNMPPVPRVWLESSSTPYSACNWDSIKWKYM